jgi:outer membrane protein OmpA-like peptidoglycan-associated protein
MISTKTARCQKEVEEDGKVTELNTKHLLMPTAIAAIALALAGPASAAECVRGSSVLNTTVVYFEFDSDKVPADAEASLKEIAARLQGNPALEVCALGQADKSGAADYNEQLALRRAGAVADILKASGLQDVQYQIKSRGESFLDDGPLAKLFGDKAEFENDRRVEVMFMNQ